MFPLFSVVYHDPSVTATAILISSQNMGIYILKLKRIAHNRMRGDYEEHWRLRYDAVSSGRVSQAYHLCLKTLTSRI